MTAEQQTPLDELILETKDGEWGEGTEAHGHTLSEVVRGTDFADLDDANLELPRRWIPDHLVARKALRAGDILIETAGGTAKQSTGRTALLTEAFFSRHSQMPVLCSSFARHLRVDTTKVRSDYLYYVLQALYRAGYMAVFNLQHTGVARFQFTSFRKKTRLALATRDAQTKIAAILSAYDDLIANNQRRIALLEGMAEEIYREWFVRMRFPGYAGRPFQGMVPNDWRAATLRDVATEASLPAKRGSHLEGRAYVPLEALATKKMLPHEHLPWDQAQSSLVTFEKNDILFGAMRPYQHKVAIAQCPGVTRSTVFTIRPKHAHLHAYLFLTLFQASSVEYATMICNGSDRPYTVWNRGFERMPIWIPEERLLQRFEQTVGPILNALGPLLAQVQALGRVRDMLMPRLISGKLKVDHLDIRLPASMRVEAEAAA